MGRLPGEAASETWRVTRGSSAGDGVGSWAEGRERVSKEEGIAYSKAYRWRNHAESGKHCELRRAEAEFEIGCGKAYCWRGEQGWGPEGWLSLNPSMYHVGTACFRRLSYCSLGV